MKHNLKQKYQWKERGMHFLDLKIRKMYTKKLVKELTAPNIWDQLSGEKFINTIHHEPSETVQAGGESALGENKGTTIPFKK